MRISPNLRSLSLPANLSGLADDIHALEERLLNSAAAATATAASPTDLSSTSESSKANPASRSGKVLRPRRRRIRRRLLKRSMSMAVMNHAGDALLFDGDDDEFVWLSTSGGESDLLDEEEEYGTEDDDSFTNYMLARRTPNISLYSRDKLGATVAAPSSATATAIAADSRHGKEPQPDPKKGGAKPQSYLPSFVGEDGDDAYGDDNSIGLMSLPDIEEEEEREDPTVEVSGTSAWNDPAHVPFDDVRTAIAILNDLSRVLGHHEPPSTISVPSPQPEEDASESGPSSPNTVIGWYPGGAEATNLFKEQAGVTQSARLPARTASLDAAKMLEAAQPASSVEGRTGTRQFTLLGPGDRTQSMPARLIPPLATAKPKKSALKRTSSVCRSQASLTTEDESMASSGGSAATAAAMNRHLQPSSRASSTNSLKRNVSFTKLDIREYSIALSDHPGCSYGPPVQLGWEYQDKESLNLEEYEEKRPPRRSVSELVMSYNVRRYLLLKRAGYSKAEIQEAMKEVERVKRDRMVTDLLLPASKIDETLEEVILSFKEILFPPPKKRPSKAQPELSRAP